MTNQDLTTIGLHLNVTDITGNVTDITGDVTGIWGDVTGIRGDVTGIWGNVDECFLTDEDRERGVDIQELVN